MEDLRDLSGLDLSSLIDTVSKNPEIMNLAKSMLASVQAERNVPADSMPSESADAIAPLPLPHSSAAHDDTQKQRDALLCALRPYLSKERRDTLDRILGIEKLTSVLLNLENVLPK